MPTWSLREREREKDIDVGALNAAIIFLLNETIVNYVTCYNSCHASKFFNKKIKYFGNLACTQKTSNIIIYLKTSLAHGFLREPIIHLVFHRSASSSSSYKQSDLSLPEVNNLDDKIILNGKIACCQPLFVPIDVFAIMRVL